MDHDFRNKISIAIRSGDLDQIRPLFTERPEAINPAKAGQSWVEMALDSISPRVGTQMLSLLLSLGCDANSSLLHYGPLNLPIGVDRSIFGSWFAGSSGIIGCWNFICGVTATVSWI
jgi:hypothetical protein